MVWFLIVGDICSRCPRRSVTSRGREEEVLSFRVLSCHLSFYLVFFFLALKVSYLIFPFTFFFFFPLALELATLEKSSHPTGLVPGHGRPRRLQELPGGQP